MCFSQFKFVILTGVGVLQCWPKIRRLHLGRVLLLLEMGYSLQITVYGLTGDGYLTVSDVLLLDVIIGGDDVEQAFYSRPHFDCFSTCRTLILYYPFLSTSPLFSMSGFTAPHCY